MSKVEQISDVQTFLDYLTSDKTNVLDANLVSDDVIEIHHENNENFIAPNAKTNVVIAAFITAYARLKLYGVLDDLQEMVLYYDTDSVIFVSKPDDPEPPLGPYLGANCEFYDKTTTWERTRRRRQKDNGAYD